MSATNETSTKKIRLQLDRILNSRSFEGVERLKRFFAFIVSETIEGRGDQLKEFVVGEYAFEKGASFDPRNDPIVRVQARRLRARLARYYLEEGQSDETVIELPKGGYVPLFRRREVQQPRRSITAVLVSRNSIVVQPFDDLSSDGTLKHLCKSMSQEIISALTKLGTVTVATAPRLAPAIARRRSKIERSNHRRRQHPEGGRSASNHLPTPRRRQRQLSLVGVHRSQVLRQRIRNPGSSRPHHRR